MDAQTALAERTSTSPETTPARRSYALGKIGAVALVSGPLLFAAGLATAPVQEEANRTSFVQSLVDHPTMSVVSGNLLHYSWVAWVVGLIAVIGMVPGRGRGHLLTRVVAVLGVVGAVQISGLMFGDFLLLALGQDVPVEALGQGFDNLDAGALVWLFSAQVMALLFVPLTFLALARAGFVRWYVAAPALVGFMVMAAPLPLHLGLVLGLACYASAFLVARILWRGPNLSASR